MRHTNVGVDAQVMNAGDSEPSQSIEMILQQVLDEVRNPGSCHSSRASEDKLSKNSFVWPM